MIIAVAKRLWLLLTATFFVALIVGRASANDTCELGHDFPTEKLYQLHKDGSIFVKNDKACTEPACFGGWFLLDNNASTVAIAAYCELYQMHNDGAVFHYTGQGTAKDQCTGGFCGNWEQLDQNPQTKAIAVGAPYFTLDAPPFLYQMHNDGAIFRRNNNPCKEAQCFGGWDTLDLNPNTVAIAAGLNGLYQLHNDGTIFRWDGKTLCDARGCVGWALLDQGPNTAIAAGHGLYRRDKDGGIFHYVGAGEQCSISPCPNWEKVGQAAPSATIISGSPQLYRLQPDGKVLRKGTAPCGTPPCLDDWVLLDQHPNTTEITAGRSLYQMRSDGSIFRFNEKPCDAAAGGCDAAWDQLDANPGTKGIVINGTLFSR